LLCSVLGKHDTSESTPGSSTESDCECFCHLLIDLPKIDLCAALLNSTTLHPTEVLHFFAAPVYDIYHPPLA
jgi:hypothetical protein